MLNNILIFLIYRLNLYKNQLIYFSEQLQCSSAFHFKYSIFAIFEIVGFN